MRTLLAAGLLLASLALTSPQASAEEPPKILMEVGQSRVIGGFGGICDDLKVATITQDQNATIKAVGRGTTLCSSRLGGSGGGIRKAYRVVVEAP